jgi:uncharacterized 2Fe-2S/4Fe-4S cluster protein (DUF4445 family)
MTKKPLIIVTFYPKKRKIKLEKDISILNAAMEANIGIRTECGGKGICGKCKIIVKGKKAVSELTESEKTHLSREEIATGYRLACQTFPKKSVEILIPEESRVSARKILKFGLESEIPLNPLVRKFHFKLKKPSLCSIEPDYERLLQALSTFSNIKDVKIDYTILEQLPDILRNAEWDVTVTVWNNRKIISVEPYDTSKILFGFAIDIGTSKIVGYLVDLNNGKTISTASIENPQIMYGSDIITRIAYASENRDNLHSLQKIVVDGINKVLAQTCAQAKVNPFNIYESTVVGNTTMHHLFLGIQPKHTATSPYVPAVKSTINAVAREIGVKMNPSGIISTLPIVAGFVGGDAVGDVLATEFHELKKTSMLIDIGTNTEVFVGNADDILSCSCASGPAFEGARVTHGVKAEIGAIERVRIGSNFDVEYETIGKTGPVGLCGSAMIDIVAEMFKHGVIDSGGRFNFQIRTPRLKISNRQAEFVVAWKNETTLKKEITITQKDIREIQLAKAAIYAGCSVLMKRKNVKEKDLNRIFIAGAFGNYINPKNAKLIGLVPDVPTEKIKFVGNTAIIGAKMALISKEARETAEALSRKIRYIELAIDSEFEKEFINAMQIPHKDLRKFPSVKGYLH